MARPNQDAIETFISITGASEAVALQKLEDHGGDLNEAVNAHFTEGDRNITHSTSIPAPQDDFMVIDDDPIQVESIGSPLPPLSNGQNLNPVSLHDPNFRGSFFEGRGATEFTSGVPRVTHPREVRAIPIDFKDGNSQSSHSGSGPTAEDVAGSGFAHGPEIHANVIVVDEEDEDIPTDPNAHSSGQNDGISGGILHERHPRPSAEVHNVPNNDNDIEEEMIQAAIEASKREDSSAPLLQQRQPYSDDTDLAHAVSLSLKTAEQEKAMREQGGLVGTAETGVLHSSDVAELGKLTTENGRGTSSHLELEAGSTSVHDEAEVVEVVEEEPLVRQRSRRVSFESVESDKDAEEMEDSPPSSPGPRDIGTHPQRNGDAFHSDEWGGISSEEHDEAVMLEAALFGGIPEHNAYHFALPRHQFLQTGSDRNTDLYPRPAPRPPSPTLEAQRLLREQQDDEYLASLQADREKELKSIEEAEMRRLKEQAAREAAIEEERQKEEESRKKLLEEEEIERQLAAKEARLPQQPALDDDNSVTLLVRMPDGSRRGRRFLNSNKLQSLFDFIDVGRGVKPGTYRLVRPYPRRAFSDGESSLSLSELGLTSKQEALFLEFI